MSVSKSSIHHNMYKSDSYLHWRQRKLVHKHTLTKNSTEYQLDGICKLRPNDTV